MLKPIKGIFVGNGIDCISNSFVQSLDRAFAERIISFNLDQHNSIGDKSGEQGGKNLTLAPTDSIRFVAMVA